MFQRDIRVRYEICDTRLQATLEDWGKLKKRHLITELNRPTTESIHEVKQSLDVFRVNERERCLK